jgi:hypothetical protein
VELSDLFQWWNLIFVLPFVGAVLYILALGFGAIGHDVDGAVDGDTSDQLGHGLPHAASADTSGDGHDAHGGIAAVLELLGVGRAPLAIVLPTFWLIWSFIGFVVNTLLHSLIEAQSAYVLVSIALAAGSALFVTGVVARALYRVMPRTETYGVETEDLVGSLGVAGYPGVSSRFGEARIYDKHGNQHIVTCRLRKDGATIQTGETVLLVDYDRAHRVFLVDPYDDRV